MRKIWLAPAALFALLTITLLTLAPATAQAPAAPALPVYIAPRFQIIPLHPSAASEWSGLLDTQTGCVWAYVTGKDGQNWQYVPVDADYGTAVAAAVKQQAKCDAVMGLPAVSLAFASFALIRSPGREDGYFETPCGIWWMVRHSRLKG